MATEARPTRKFGILRLSASILALAALLLSSAPAGVGRAASGADWPVDGGWFFTQTRGQEAEGAGYAVIDTANVPFWSEFERLGGVESLGYPTTHRFTWDGAVSQAFQRGVLQWRPETGVTLANSFDALSKAGLDDWLMATYAVPRADDGKAANVSLLNQNASIAQAYNAVPNAKTVLGLPIALEDFGPLVTLRTEKMALQQWKVETAWAPVGAVTIPNAGDVLAASGLVPADAAKAQQVGYIGGYGGGYGGYYPYGPVAAPQPAYYYPYYPTYHPPVVQSLPYYPYYPYGYNYNNYYQPYGYGFNLSPAYGYGNYAPNYGYGNYGYGAPMTYPYAPYAPYAPNRYPSYPSYPYNYQPYGYGGGYGNYGGYGQLPQAAVCQGDEQMTFNPNRPNVNQQFTIEVTSARPHQPFQLEGPGNPQFRGVRGGGKGYIWSWQATIGNNGNYNFNFRVNGGTVCTANVVQVG